MTLSTIQLRINSKAYKTRGDFVADLQQIVHNCLTYNGDDTCKHSSFLLVSFIYYTPICSGQHLFELVGNTEERERARYKEITFANKV